MPAEVVEPAVEALLQHARDLALFLRAEQRELRPDSLREVLTQLVEYAQGKRQYQPHLEYLVIRLVHSLYTSAWEARGGQIRNPETRINALDLDDPLGLVLKACIARFRLELDELITAVDLAVLADVTLDHVRLLVRQGELPDRRTDPDPRLLFTAPEARAFLRVRGVRGMREELGLQDRVVMRGADRTFIRLFLDHDAPKEHVGERGLVIALGDNATAACSVRLDSGEVVSVEPKWLSRS